MTPVRIQPGACRLVRNVTFHNQVERERIRDLKLSDSESSKTMVSEM